jgi:hypothetical protein
MHLKSTIALAVVLVAATIVHGKLTDRWGVPGEVSKAAAKLDEVPTEIVGWQSTSNEVSPRVLKMAGAEKILDRDYKSADGDQIRVMIVCGRPGPVSRHPPTVCFTASGLKQVSEVQTVDRLVGENVELGKFAQCLFLAEGSSAKIDTQWSFSANGHTWQKPSDPRFAFAGQGWLYKLYVIAVDTKDERAIANREAFTKQLLTELATTLL